MSLAASPPNHVYRTPTYDSVNDPITRLYRRTTIIPLESPQDRQLRLQLEKDAKVNSDAIDAQLLQERDLLKRKKATGSEVKLLLLGQAESGKSTLQKQFQLLYAPNSLDGERSSWKVVIYLNIVRALKSVLDALDEPLNWVQSKPIKSSDRRLQETCLRLTPILTMEDQLASALVGGVQLSSNTPKQGFYSRFGWQWASRSSKTRRSFSLPGNSEDKEHKEELYDNSKVVIPMERLLTACSEDICNLWAHPAVKDLLSARKLYLNEWSEYFLSNIARIATVSYIPSTDDILRARLQTIGVAEHRYEIMISGKLQSWHIYDVGGARGQRHIWAPYVSEANAIIFLAPLSAFDQNLEEDEKVNRISDSVGVFKEICANQLLKKVHLVLFLNKSDLLRAKLDSGTSLRKYVTSYGDRPNQFEDVVAYFRMHFVLVHKQSGIKTRVLYPHVTNMVDTRATKKIIDNVRDTLFRTNLKSAALIP